MQANLKLAVEIAKTYPREAARILEEQYPASSSAIIDAIPDGESISILSSMLPRHAAKCIEQFESKIAARYLKSLDSKSVVNILRHVSKEHTQNILDLMPRNMSIRISLLMNYTPSMVGYWIQSNTFSLPMDCSMKEAKLRIRNEKNIDSYRIFVTDTYNKLLGFVPLVSFISAPDSGLIKDYLQPFPAVLQAGVSREDALKLPAWSEYDSIPVIDRRKNFLGLVRYAVLRMANTDLHPSPLANGTSKLFLELTENCYVGLAELMTATLANEPSATTSGQS